MKKLMAAAIVAALFVGVTAIPASADVYGDGGSCHLVGHPTLAGKQVFRGSNFMNAGAVVDCYVKLRWLSGRTVYRDCYYYVAPHSSERFFCRWPGSWYRIILYRVRLWADA